MGDIHKKYRLRRVINACGKMTSLCGASVLPEIAKVVHEGIQDFFELDDLQRAAGEVIARATGAESGCVTACTAAGITLSVAACMTGSDLARVHQLPDTAGMKSRVLIQKGHCVNFGAPITQMIRLAGARVTEVGEVERSTPAQLRDELEQGDVAAIVAVESHHTVPDGWVRLPELVPLAAEYDVPVILDGAAQDQRLMELIELGCDLVIASAHKFLCSTTGGVVAGRKDLVDAVYLQNRGIGRGMKAGKEAVLGAIAALEYRMQQDMGAWTTEQDRKVQLILDQLAGVPGLGLSVDPDPNGCPFSRARLTPDPQATGCSARQLTDRLAEGDPTVVARGHHADEGYILLDAIEMNDQDIQLACDRVRQILVG
ncbi:MAG: aminotransferase class V-fold PLP-dependent enzyme [Pirellulaceae bacterium]